MKIADIDFNSHISLTDANTENDTNYTNMNLHITEFAESHHESNQR